MKLHANDTIAAIATPPGDGAIAVIRISGPDALATAAKVYRGKNDIAQAEGYTVHYGKVVSESGEPVDVGLFTVFREPHSYTGEDSVEISCHGGRVVTCSVLSTVLKSGARLAEPGEFTKRAFLNGKLDLSQAEAVADLIAAQSVSAARASMAQLDGRLGSRVSCLRNDMLDLCGLLELELDFSEEGIPLVSRDEVISRIEEVVRSLQEIEDTFRLGRMYRDGITIVLIGPPNVGKSSIFNMLLRENRAIVTPIPGTTRDALEENITIDGVLFRLVDTAGLRQPGDIVETEGIRRSRSWAERADVVLNVRDITSLNGFASKEFEPLDSQLVIYVANKVDLLPTGETAHWKGTQSRQPLLLSAKTGAGLDDLRGAIMNMTVGQHRLADDGVLVVAERHAKAIELARESLARASSAVRSGITNEFVAIEVREAAMHLASITGESMSDDILNTIFSRFCIGK